MIGRGEVGSLFNLDSARGEPVPAHRGGKSRLHIPPLFDWM
jgi:hypothetical protein